MEVNEVNGVYDIVAKSLPIPLIRLKRNYNSRDKNNRYDQVDDDTDSNRIEREWRKGETKSALDPLL